MFRNTKGIKLVTLVVILYLEKFKKDINFKEKQDQASSRNNRSSANIYDAISFN